MWYEVMQVTHVLLWCLKLRFLHAFAEQLHSRTVKVCAAADCHAMQLLDNEEMQRCESPLTVCCAAAQALMGLCLFVQHAIDNGWLVGQDGRANLVALLSCAHEASLGMAQLHRQNILHGALSPTTCFLTAAHNQRGFTVKVRCTNVCGVQIQSVNLVQDTGAVEIAI